MKRLFTTNNSVLIVLPALGLLASAAHGQASDGFVSGAMTFKPRLGLEIERNDNIYTSRTEEIASVIFVQKPGLLVEIEPGRHQFEIEYSGEFGQYRENSDDDYADQRFAAAALFDLGTSHRLSLSGSYFDGHEERGSGLSRSQTPADSGFPTRPDEYSDRLLQAGYRLGATDATGRIEVGLGSNKHEYDNNRSRTRFFDRSQDFASGAFFYRFRPGTHLVFDAQRKEVEYDTPRAGEASRDGAELRLRAGVTWEPTGKTSGRVSVGHIRKEFDDPARPEFTGVSWEVNVRWSPRTYSHFDFQTSREPAETLGDGDFMDTRIHRVTWSHDWSDSWQTRLGGRFRDEEFVGTPRKEDRVEWSFDLRYRIRRWMTIELGATRQSTDSTIASLEYDTAVYRLGIEFAP